MNRTNAAHRGPLPPEPALRISDTDVKQFAGFFYQHTGIAFAEAKHGMLRTQVTNALTRLGYKTFADAFSVLRSPSGATHLQEVINALTINETYFYREKYQFETLVEMILPKLTATAPRGSRLRIWSLPCSTGEEPYSISIYLRENWPGWHIFNTNIFGSDIDTNVLKSAVRAQYNQRAIARMPEELHSRYFKAQPCGTRFSLTRDVADGVVFNQVNLLERRMMATMHSMDVIFCRNVLIYLDEPARKAAVKNLYDCLKPNGCLLLGHSETMAWMSGMFDIERHGGSVVYRKR
jgi:chemotaxis protein methyltransferase CheR